MRLTLALSPLLSQRMAFIKELVHTAAEISDSGCIGLVTGHGLRKLVATLLAPHFKG